MSYYKLFACCLFLLLIAGVRSAWSETTLTFVNGSSLTFDSIERDGTKLKCKSAGGTMEYDADTLTSAERAKYFPGIQIINGAALQATKVSANPESTSVPTGSPTPNPPTNSSMLAQEGDGLANYNKHPLLLTKNPHNLSISSEDGVSFTLTPTGEDPYVFFDGFGDFYQENKPYVIAFEYIAEKAGSIKSFCLGKGKQDAMQFDAVLPKATEWTPFLLDISQEGKGLGVSLEWLRLNPPSSTLRIRNIHLVEADLKLQRRAGLGDMAEKLDTLGISTKGISGDQCSMETVRHGDQSSCTIVKSVYGHLDLDARAKQESKQDSARALVPLGPALAAGEGEHPDNHTVVRILDKYQLPEVQFLAYPPTVKGGVGIDSLALNDNEYGFACHPLMDKNTSTIKLFNRYGGLIREIRVDGIVPPFTVAAGPFLQANPGPEIAVASRYEPSSVCLFSVDGKLLLKTPAPGQRRNTTCHLAVINNDQLVYQDIQAKKLFRFTDSSIIRRLLNQLTGESAFTPFLDLEKIPNDARVFASVYPGKLLNAGKVQEIISTLYGVNKDGSGFSQDAGLRENTFYYSVLKTHGGSTDPWPDIPDSKYIRNEDDQQYHQAQDWGPLVRTGNIKNRSRADWLAGVDWINRSTYIRDKGILARNRSIEQYDEGRPAVWDVNFSHRWNIGLQGRLIRLTDEKGLPEYLCLDRRNGTRTDGYFDKATFTLGSYNFEQPELQDFYHLMQGEFHKRLAVPYRKNPEQLVAVKPSHENEVNSGPGSFGDYNPHNILGFYRYLLALYGDRDTINTMFGTSYTDGFFDPPRNYYRGSWDAYSDDNPLFREWVEYNKITVYRRVGESQLGVLLAGIPPQLLRSHQIPDKYIGKTVAGIMANSTRITPIDWFMTAGTGVGHTRYGVWYKSQRNALQGAWSSGFDDSFMGEYASKTGDANAAWEQLKYAVTHGLKGAYVMAWPDPQHLGYNTTQISALQRLHQECGDTPLPGLAGGISEVRGYAGSGGSFDIAALGCTEKNTGLLKSVKEDGSFEGTVYVVPFHSHVDVNALVETAALPVDDKPKKLCEIDNIRQGCVVEINFTVPKDQPAEELEILLSHNGVKLPDFSSSLKHLEAGKNVRVIYKFPIIMNKVDFEIVSRKTPINLENVHIYRHQDLVVNLTRDIWDGERHKGGVTFDVLKEAGGI